MTAGPGIRLGRSRTVRAAALVTVGLAATACGDETPPPDTPLDANQRVEACEAAHRRLDADPANCAVLERVAQIEQAATRPRFSLLVGCEAQFGRGACEGGGGALSGQQWRPVLAGWSQPDSVQPPSPAIRDRQGQLWLLGAPEQPPMAVPDSMLTAQPEGMTPTRLAAFDRLAPLYDDEAACGADWTRCERATMPNRFVDRGVCEAIWTACRPVSLANAPEAATQTSSSGHGGSSHGGGSRFFWWYGYNNAWSTRAGGAYAPRWQGWGWTGDRAPTATYRSAGVQQGWDSARQRLAPARSLASIAGDGGGALSSRTEAVSRAGFGSTGRSYSAGG